MKNVRVSLPARPTLRLAALSFSALVAVAPALVAGPPAAEDGKSGTIRGHVVWGGKGIPDAKVIVKKGDPKVKDPAVCAANDLKSKVLTIDPASLGVADAIVYVLKPTGITEAEQEALLKKAVEKNPELVIDQVNCEYVPYTSAGMVGQKIVYKSSDAVGHNVHTTVLAGPSINVMVPQNGKTSQVFKDAPKRVIPLQCDIHPWMEGQFQIFDHPFFAVTKADGSFEITGVPAGTQKLVIFHKTKGYINEGKAKGQDVEVKAGDVKDIGDVKLPQ